MQDFSTLHQTNGSAVKRHNGDGPALSGREFDFHGSTALIDVDDCSDIAFFQPVLDQTLPQNDDIEFIDLVHVQPGYAVTSLGRSSPGSVIHTVTTVISVLRGVCKVPRSEYFVPYWACGGSHASPQKHTQRRIDRKVAKIYAT
jgi:hypothetical protein